MRSRRKSRSFFCAHSRRRPDGEKRRRAADRRNGERAFIQSFSTITARPIMARASSSKSQPAQAPSRPTTRSATSLRALTISHGVLPQSHSTGSSSFSLGPHQSSLASVQGPIEVRIRDEVTDGATLQVTAIPLKGQQGVAANSFAVGTMQKALRSVVLLERYPRTLIQVVIQTTDEAKVATPLEYRREAATRGGGKAKALSIRPQRPHPDASWSMAERATSINAAGLALIQAGISCSATVCAVSVAIVPQRVARLTRKGGKERATAASSSEEDDDADSSSHAIVVDPEPFEEEQASSLHLFAFALAGRVLSCDDGQLQGQPEARLILVESEGGKMDARLVSSSSEAARIA